MHCFTLLVHDFIITIIINIIIIIIIMISSSINSFSIISCMNSLFVY